LRYAGAREWLPRSGRSLQRRPAAAAQGPRPAVTGGVRRQAHGQVRFVVLLGRARRDIGHALAARRVTAKPSHSSWTILSQGSWDVRRVPRGRRWDSGSCDKAIEGACFAGRTACTRRGGASKRGTTRAACMARTAVRVACSAAAGPLRRS